MAIKKYHVSKNIFNKATALDNRDLSASTGNVVPYISGKSVSDFIPVSALNYYFTQVTTICEYDTNQQRVAGTNTENNPNFARTLQSTTKYIRIAFNTNSTDVVMINEGSTALPYEEYYTPYFETIGYKKYETATDTFNTYPHEVIGDGQPISAYTIKGNMSQSGTPTPSNPVYPTEVGEKTANLFDKNATNTNNGYVANSRLYGGTVEANNECDISEYIAIEASETYTMSGFYAGWSSSLAFYTSEKVAISAIHYENKRVLTFTAPSNAAYLRVTISKATIDTQMINVGNEASSYEPFGYKIPISFGQGTYTSYLAEPIRKIGTNADTLPSTGTAARNIYKYEFKGTEMWSLGTNQVFISLNNLRDIPTPIGASALVCSHFPNDNTGIVNGNSWFFQVYGYTAVASDEATWKQYLAQQYANGTPVTVWYQLATPTTESFTAPTLPTTGTAETFDVSTTLKPSEVSLTYHGWHEHEDTKYTTP